MLASYPASILNQKMTSLGIPNRLRFNSSRFSTAPIARLRGGRIWALGAQMGDDVALGMLAGDLLQRWRAGDKLVALGNMLGPNGDPARTMDGLLVLRRRLLASRASRTCDVVFLRGAQEEMWHKALRLQFAVTPLEVLEWMLARGPAARRPQRRRHGAAVGRRRGCDKAAGRVGRRLLVERAKRCRSRGRLGSRRRRGLVRPRAAGARRRLLRPRGLGRCLRSGPGADRHAGRAGPGGARSRGHGS